MRLINHLTKVLQMVGSPYDSPYQLQSVPAGKPIGKGNNTQPFCHVKSKKKKFGERKLSKKQRKM